MRCLLAVLIFALAAASSPGNSKEIHIPVWAEPAVESSGLGLTEADLSAKLEGSPLPVLSVRGPDDDLLLLLVADMVEDLSQVIPAKQALVDQIYNLPSNAYVGLLRAQDGLRVLLDPTGDREAVAAAIDALPVSGRAGLLDTVETAARIADSILAKTPVRVAVLYVSDSDVRNYREDFTNPVINQSDPRDLSRRFPEGLVRDRISKLDTALAGLQAPVFVVHVDYRSDRLNEAYQSGLIQLTATTGGASIFCRSRAEIPDAIASMFRTITSHYSVGVELPEQTPRMLQVQLESDGRTLNYRPRFVVERK